MNIIKIFFLLDTKIEKTHFHMQIPTTSSLQPRTVVCNTLNHMKYMQRDLRFSYLKHGSSTFSCIWKDNKMHKNALYITCVCEQDDLSII